jgi:glycosyltransferase involved in cell wall biosynthesis
MPDSTPFRVLHVLAPAPVGGAEQVVIDLGRALLDLGIDARVAAVLDRGWEDHPFLRQVPPGLQVYPLFVPHRAYHRERAGLLELLARVRPAVVHTHGYRSNVIGAAAARSMALPVVATVHGFTGRGWKIRTFQLLERWSLRRASAVVAVSRPLADQVRTMGVPAPRIHLIPNARVAPSDLLSPHEARNALRVDAERFHVGWIGRMTREKAPDIMLHAIEVVHHRGSIPNLHVTFIGDGRQRAVLQARSRQSDLESQVSWAGEVPNASRLLRGFDLIVLSSRSEGTPIIALEAMTVGVPMVATAVGGVPELTGPDGAYLVPPQDPQAIADAIERVYGRPHEAEQLASRSQARVREHASPERWARNHVAVYRSVAPQCSPGAPRTPPA